MLWHWVDQIFDIHYGDKAKKGLNGLAASAVVVPV